MPSGIWDYFKIDEKVIKELEGLNNTSFLIQENINLLKQIEDNLTVNVESTQTDENKILRIQSSLSSVETCSQDLLKVVDNVIISLNEIGTDYEDVTGRTNSLMMNCENLLEQQQVLYKTVDTLKATLAPFQKIDEIANQLGIPLEYSNSGSSKSSFPSFSSAQVDSLTTLDPRSPEFQDILNHLAESTIFIRNHPEIRDGQQYLIWLEKLQNRATSLVARAMRELIDKATKACLELNQSKLYNKSVAQIQNKSIVNSSHPVIPTNATSLLFDDIPIESAPIYQKFRGLSYRLRELTILLKTNANHSLRDASHSRSNISKQRSKPRLNGDLLSLTLPTESSALLEVKQSYVQIRNDLLLTFVKDSWSNLTEAWNQNKLTSVGSANGITLGSIIRHAFSTLLRITQLEQQLFDSLFNVDINTTTSSGSISSHSNDTIEVKRQRMTSNLPLSEADEVLVIIDNVGNSTRDFLRPFIIQESSVDELCKVVSTLSEDVRSQMLAMPVPKLLLKHLLSGLDKTVNDARERLTYCAETRLRQDVQMFEPLPSQVAYPEILEKYFNSLETHSTVTTQSSTSANAGDIYSTWYPPVRHTLSLLSKLYGVVDMAVFEDWGRRSIESCVYSLRNGSDLVKRTRPHLHGDLFLIRHLLILREQLVPFEIHLHGMERQLDFSNTNNAFAQLVSSMPKAQQILRMDRENIILQFALLGSPTLHETKFDTKKDLDEVLKNACASLKQSALKMLLGPLDGFLAKVTAFVGEFPTANLEHSTTATESLNSPSEDLVEEMNGGQSSAIMKEISSNDSQKATRSSSSSVVLLSNEQLMIIKNQAFIRPERIKEMLESVQNILVQTAPDLKSIMKLYIENQLTRTILLRPVLQEFDVCKKKMECVISSCFERGVGRKELEQLVRMISQTVQTELTQG